MSNTAASPCEEKHWTFCATKSFQVVLKIGTKRPLFNLDPFSFSSSEWRSFAEQVPQKPRNLHIRLQVFRPQSKMRLPGHENWQRLRIVEAAQPLVSTRLLLAFAGVVLRWGHKVLAHLLVVAFAGLLSLKTGELLNLRKEDVCVGTDRTALLVPRDRVYSWIPFATCPNTPKKWLSGKV